MISFGDVETFINGNEVISARSNMVNMKGGLELDFLKSSNVCSLHRVNNEWCVSECVNIGCNLPFVFWISDTSSTKMGFVVEDTPDVAEYVGE